MSDIVINGKTYSGVDSITVNKASGGTTKYTEGERPTGSIEITENGTHNVADYENAVVKVGGEDRLQWKCDNVKSLYYEFYYYTGTEIPILKGLDTSNVTNMSNMFYNCRYLTSLDVSNFDTSDVTNMSNMFSFCSELTSLDVSNFDTSDVTNMSKMFQGLSLKSLDVSNFNTSKVTDMSYMFGSCYYLTSLDLSNFDTSNVTNMSYMFQRCDSLISLDLSNFDTSKVTTMAYMFQGCAKLETLLNLDLIKKPNTTSMLQNCEALKNLKLYNIQKFLTIGSGTSWGTLLTLDSLVHTIQQLWDLTGSTSQTLTMSTASKNLIADVYVKLVEPTAEQIEADPNIIYKKNCVVCESTDEGAMTITEYATSKNWAIA